MGMFRRLLQLLHLTPREQPRPVPPNVQRHNDGGGPLHASAQRPTVRQGDIGAVPSQFPGSSGGIGSGGDPGGGS
ncbi:MAG: hypothetical protein QOJ13_509 [Gaiellales bacterium]|jgi:hypothetical protein|nr:hypothetical protein [Gaiellales bacterium]